jgi:hypothetical protein
MVRHVDCWIVIEVSGKRCASIFSFKVSSSPIRIIGWLIVKIEATRSSETSISRHGVTFKENWMFNNTAMKTWSVEIKWLLKYVTQISFGVRLFICLLIIPFIPFGVESRSLCQYDKKNLEVLILSKVNFSRRFQKLILNLGDDNRTSGWKLRVILLIVWRKTIHSINPINKKSISLFLHLLF